MGNDKTKARPEGRSGRNEDTPARVWAEAGVTMAVTDRPPQFVRVSFGVERTARGNSKKAIREEEERLFDYCVDVVNKRAAQMAETVEEATRELLEGIEEYPYQ